MSKISSILSDASEAAKSLAGDLKKLGYKVEVGIDEVTVESGENSATFWKNLDASWSCRFNVSERTPSKLDADRASDLISKMLRKHGF